MKNLYVFMTHEDNETVSVILNENFENLEFINVEPKQSKNLITEKGLFFPVTLILNKEITPLKDYLSLAKEIGGFYHYPKVGRGMIMYYSSKHASYNKKCLKDGFLTCSYDKNDIETHQFVKKVFSLIKSKGKKVYRISPTRGIKADIAEKNYYAWQNAMNKYNGQNNQYLTIGNDIWLIAQ